VTAEQTAWRLGVPARRAAARFTPALVWAPALAGGAAAAVVAGPAVGAVTVLAASIAAAPLLRDQTGRAGDVADLERQLARCRRRGESATVLVARVAGHHATVQHVRSLLRLSDAVLAARAVSGVDLCAVIDGVDLDREALEERLRHSLSADLLCGWAVFPDEGLTLDLLIAAARAHPVRAAAVPTQPAPTLSRRPTP
jgi:hypothetical protein